MKVIKNIKVRKTLVSTLKALLFVGVLYFFVQQISRITLNQFQSLQFESPLYFVLVVFLLPFNWGLEFWKWKRVLNSNHIKYNFKQFASSLFSGVTTGIVTPNRIGNFIGRMLYFKGKVRGQLILGTLYSNFSQFLVTLLFGSLSFLIINELIFDAYGQSLLNISISISLLSLLFYFLVPFVQLPRLKFLKRKQNILQHFQKQSIQLVIPLFFMSVIRFFVFSIQFLLMLMAFGVAPSITIYAGILMVYLVSTLTPSLIFGKLIVRETAGLIILGFFIGNDLIIVISSMLLWFVNLGVPTLIGLYFIAKKKTFTNG